jgi:hypothetical protein
MAALALLTAAPSAAAADWVLSPSSIDTGKIQSGGPPKDGIPALTEPQYVAAGEADYLSGGDRVLGLEVNGDARAYPLRILSWHELVNDTVGGEKILVSW